MAAYWRSCGWAGFHHVSMYGSVVEIDSPLADATGLLSKSDSWALLSVAFSSACSFMLSPPGVHVLLRVTRNRLFPGTVPGGCGGRRSAAASAGARRRAGAPVCRYCRAGAFLDGILSRCCVWAACVFSLWLRLRHWFYQLVSQTCPSWQDRAAQSAKICSSIKMH